MKLQMSLLAAGALLSAFSSTAQGAPPVVTDVQGVATAIQSDGTQLVKPGAQVQDGTRLVTTSSGAVTLRGAGGCSVRVPPGHGVTVSGGMDCRQIKSSVVPVIPDVAARSPSAPPPKVLDRLVQVGASPTAVGVMEQLTDDPPISGR